MCLSAAADAVAARTVAALSEQSVDDGSSTADSGCYLDRFGRTVECARAAGHASVCRCDAGGSACIVRCCGTPGLGECEHTVRADINAGSAPCASICIELKRFSVQGIVLIHCMPPFVAIAETAQTNAIIMPIAAVPAMTGKDRLTSRSTPFWLVNVDDPVKFIARYATAAPESRKAAMVGMRCRKAREGSMATAAGRMRCAHTAAMTLSTVKGRIDRTEKKRPGKRGKMSGKPAAPSVSEDESQAA